MAPIAIAVLITTVQHSATQISHSRIPGRFEPSVRSRLSCRLLDCLLRSQSAPLGKPPKPDKTKQYDVRYDTNGPAALPITELIVVSVRGGRPRHIHYTWVHIPCTHLDRLIRVPLRVALADSIPRKRRYHAKIRMRVSNPLEIFDDVHCPGASTRSDQRFSQYHFGRCRQIFVIAQCLRKP